MINEQHFLRFLLEMLELHWLGFEIDIEKLTDHTKRLTLKHGERSLYCIEVNHYFHCCGVDNYSNWFLLDKNRRDDLREMLREHKVLTRFFIICIIFSAVFRIKGLITLTYPSTEHNIESYLKADRMLNKFKKLFPTQNYTFYNANSGRNVVHHVVDISELTKSCHPLIHRIYSMQQYKIYKEYNEVPLETIKTQCQSFFKKFINEFNPNSVKGH